MNITDRFMEHVEPRGDGCWLWTGTLNRGGYGDWQLLHEDIGAHRAAYLLFVGDLDPRLAIHHVCGVRACVNPDHLQMIGLAEHSRLHWDERMGRGSTPRASCPDLGAFGQALAASPHSAADCARALKVSRTAISRWASGERAAPQDAVDWLRRTALVSVKT